MIHIHLTKYRAKRQGVCDARELIGMQICEKIGSAIKAVKDSRDVNHMMTEIIGLYQSSGFNLDAQIITEKKLHRSTPNKIFKEIEKDGVFLLVPASNALTIVLANNLEREPTIEKLIELVM